jgi:hypothetical protein
MTQNDDDIRSCLGAMATDPSPSASFDNRLASLALHLAVLCDCGDSTIP